MERLFVVECVGDKNQTFPKAYQDQKDAAAEMERLENRETAYQWKSEHPGILFNKETGKSLMYRVVPFQYIPTRDG